MTSLNHIEKISAISPVLESSIALGLPAGFAIYGGVKGYKAKRKDIKTKSGKKEFDRGSAVGRAVSGALGGAAEGWLTSLLPLTVIKGFGGGARGYRRNYSGFGSRAKSDIHPQYHASMADLDKATTKAEAKTIYRSGSMKFHPDKQHGKSDQEIEKATQHFKAHGQAWEDFKGSRAFEKLSHFQQDMMRAMFEEMEKLGNFCE